VDVTAPTAAPRKPRHPESEVQRAFVARWRLDPRTRDWPACAVPNGGRRGIVEASILKAEGVSRGVPDWLCFRPGTMPHGTPCVGLAIEFKRPDKRTRATPEQLAWHQQLRACGWRVEIARTAEEAWAIVAHTYWHGEPPRFIR
jgi:hypothetical protein